METKLTEPALSKTYDWDKHYVWEPYCTNCGQRNKRYILKGVKIAGQQFDCDNCGCKIVGKERY